MSSNKFKIKWFDHKKEPTEKPNPKYPNGIDILTHIDNRPFCISNLPYPAKRCGVYVVTCQKCKMQVMVTTAGRPDDPRSISISCDLK